MEDRGVGGSRLMEAAGPESWTGGGLETSITGVSPPASGGCGELGLVATTMSSMASGLRGLGVLAPLLASVLQLSSLRPRPDLPDEF